MAEVFEWQLITAGMQCAALLNSPQLQLRLAISVPATLFRNAARMQDIIQRSLDSCRLDWRHLQLEISEAAISEDTEQSLKVLRELRKRGVALAIDNFGTGVSSLRHLRRFRIDIIKIDASFVRDVLADENDAAVTSAIIALAHQLDLKVLADGVESQQHARFLERYWCDYLQGAHVSKPLLKAELIAFLKNRLQKF
jgi:EAL domain-containing protein (putative c-di-GMP-specific phosphodiesterase class I)